MEAAIKTIFGTIIALVTYVLSCVNAIVLILFIFMIFDYITGITVAIKNKAITRSKSIWGIVRKMVYGIIIAVAFLVDYALGYSVSNLGVNLDYVNGILGMVVVFFFLGTEVLSIADNCEKLGVKFPPMLKKIGQSIKNINFKNDGSDDNDN